MILDGRDSPPKNALNSLKKIKSIFGNLNFISSISGRYYAMDRDKRWERTELFYRTIVFKEGGQFDNPERFIKLQYEKKIHDEFFKPTVSKRYSGINNKKDGIIFLNFRSDRMVKIKNTIGEVVSKTGLKQLRLSETEKYAHVTYFFNCGNEQKFKGEDRILIQSPKIKTYDLQPEMAIEKVTVSLINALETFKYDFVVVNFANPDMVGHSGNLTAAIKACEAVDNSLKKLIDAAQKTKSNLLIVADHGNCEEMINYKTNQPHTSHTLNLVPIILISDDQNLKIGSGNLSDVAPTLLDLMKINKPREMTGRSLIIK